MRARLFAVAASLVVVLWFCVRRIGLATHDVLLAYAVAGFAAYQRKSEGTNGVLLGEDGGDAIKPLVWREFVVDNHQLLSCFVRGSKGIKRSERFLALAVSTCALIELSALLHSFTACSS